MNRLRLLFGICVSVLFGSVAQGAMKSLPRPINRSNSCGGSVALGLPPLMQEKFSPTDDQSMNIDSDTSSDEEFANKFFNNVSLCKSGIGFSPSPSMNNISFLSDERASTPTNLMAKDTLSHLLSIIYKLSHSPKPDCLEVSELYFKVIQAFDRLAYEIEINPKYLQNLSGDGSHICAQINDKFAGLFGEINYNYLLQQFKRDIFRYSRTSLDQVTGISGSDIEKIEQLQVERKYRLVQNLNEIEKRLDVNLGEDVKELLDPFSLFILWVCEQSGEDLD